MSEKNSPYRQTLLILMSAFGIVWIASIFIAPALGQDLERPDGSVPLPMDWSNRYVIYTVGATDEQLQKMRSDPRYFVAMRLHGKELEDEGVANGYPALMKRRSRREPPSLKERDKRDWSISLGPTAGVAAGAYPAKFSFDVNATPSCTGDYVVFPVNASTGFTRSNVAGTFSTTTASAGGDSVTFTVTPTGGSSIMLTLTSSTTLNTGKNFQVFTTASSANATTEALNLALAINRNLTATSGGGGIAAVASTNTVTVYTVRAGNQVILSSPTNSVPGLTFGGVTNGVNGTQANLVGVNNLYSGSGTPLCTGKTFPTFIFSYASGYGAVSTSPVLSLDGTKIAYIENGPALGAVLHVLKFSTGSTEYGSCSNTGAALPTCATAPVVPSTGTSTATAYAIPFLSALATASTPSATAVAATRSAPFVNYSTDTLFVGDNNGNLYSVTGVFQGTPTLAGGNFPVAVSPGNVLNSPVVDVSGTGNIFLGDSLSKVYEYSSAGVLQGSSSSIGNGTNGGIWDGALVDSTNQKAYYTTTCSGASGNSELAQIPFTSTGLGTVTTSINTNGEGCAAGAQRQFGATPDNLYYTEGISSSSTTTNGHILLSYQGTGSVRLAEWGFTSGALQTTRLFDTNSIYTGASVGGSASTEFYGNSVAYTPTNVTQSGTTVTVTTASNLFITGQVVTIAGVAAGSGGCTTAAVAAINGEHTITAISATQFTFTSAVSTTIAASSCTLTGSSATGSTQDYLFFGSGQPAVYTFTLPMTSNTQAPSATNTTSVTTVAGGASATSGIIVDNESGSGQASSIYFGTQAASTSQCGGTTTTPLYCAVKVTQTGLQ